ncbi:MAG: SxtJ family membrane protein [Phycisphaerae bacterium]|jgi:hypothetical protein
MALVSLNLHPTKKVLRDFGLAALFMSSLLGLMLLWMGKISLIGLGVIFLVGVIVFVLSRISDKLAKPFYLALIILTFPIGWIVSHLIMAVFYYGIITPVAIVFKLLRRDPLYRKYDPQAQTYWIEYKRKRSDKDYFHQF